MSWAYFQNQAAWDSYHNAACVAHAIPRPGYRASNNTTVMLANQWTDAWVNPIQFKAQGNVTTWVAQVPDVDVTTYGLTAIPDTAVVFNPNGTISVTVGGRTYVNEPLTMNFHKSKPPTWTDPHDGHVYTVTP
jgi:hypothetical protein